METDFQKSKATTQFQHKSKGAAYVLHLCKSVHLLGAKYVVCFYGLPNKVNTNERLPEPRRLAASLEATGLYIL